MNINLNLRRDHRATGKTRVPVMRMLRHQRSDGSMPGVAIRNNTCRALLDDDVQVQVHVPVDVNVDVEVR